MASRHPSHRAVTSIKLEIGIERRIDDTGIRSACCPAPFNRLSRHRIMHVIDGNAGNDILLGDSGAVVLGDGTLAQARYAVAPAGSSYPYFAIAGKGPTGKQH
jgi:hypothetical protein